MDTRVRRRGAHPFPLGAATQMGYFNSPLQLSTVADFAILLYLENDLVNSDGISRASCSFVSPLDQEAQVS